MSSSVRVHTGQKVTTNSAIPRLNRIEHLRVGKQKCSPSRFPIPHESKPLHIRHSLLQSRIARVVNAAFQKMLQSRDGGSEQRSAFGFKMLFEVRGCVGEL